MHKLGGDVAGVDVLEGLWVGGDDERLVVKKTVKENDRAVRGSDRSDVLVDDDLIGESAAIYVRNKVKDWCQVLDHLCLPM